MVFGGDWRRLTPTYTIETYSANLTTTKISDLQNGLVTQLSIEAIAPGAPIFNNLSAYVQDHWMASPHLMIDAGLRWEFDPPPEPSNGRYPLALTSGNLATAMLAPAGTQPYKTYYDKFAPRFGFAWDVIPSRKFALTVRGGFGIFFDTGQDVIGYAYSGNYPFAISRAQQTEVPLPLSAAASAPPSLSIAPTPPYPQLLGLSNPNLTLPYTEQWNLSVDEALNKNDKFTVTYLGNNGRKLLFTQSYISIPGNPLFTSLNMTSNTSQSSYNALQVQNVGRLAKYLDLVGSFTYAHALDNASTSASNYAPIYGNSANDIRRLLNFALNYQIPRANWGRWTEALTHGWLLANRFAAQSGYPITTLTETNVTLSNGVSAQYYPNLVPGVPIYLHGSAAHATGYNLNWRLNRAAFACTTTGATSGACSGTPTVQGSLGRNYVRNPPFWAMNTAAERSFAIYENFQLKFRAEGFNIFNHPNIGNPTPTLSSAAFGETVGTVTTIGSSNTFYAMGAARSLQFSLHLQF
jgi:hypothetical protein